VLAIRIILYFTAVIVLFYPISGVIDPASYLNGLLEKFPFAQGASDAQIQQSSLIQIASNAVLAIAFIFAAKFISKPKSYLFAKISAIALMLYPILQSMSDAFIGRILAQQTQDASISVGFSSQNVIYILFGLIILGISKSQQEYNQPIKQD
jgi:hypothetical protein